jgi:cytochrome oxidase Cu insertion factor (SCO1/SenC/PrrC family)
VDPRGDTRPAVREFLRRHRAPDNLHYLIGSEAQLRPVWKDWYAAPQIQGDPNSAHTAAIWLIDARGRIAGKFDAGVPVKPSELAEELGKLEDRG